MADYLLTSPYLPYSCSYGFGPPYTIFDRLPYGGYWIQPRQVIYNVFEQRKPSYECKKLSKRCGRYYMTERNGREVVIGEMNISNALVVNPRADGSFDCIYCDIKGEGMPEKRACQFPIDAIRKHNPLPYILDYHRNPDCPPEYIIAAFFEELFNNNDLKFLSLPPHSGGNLLEGRWGFVSAESVIPQLEEYYESDIPLRHLLQTDKSLCDASEELAMLLPDNNACRVLLNANVSSILLGLYEEQQFKTDRMFVVCVECERDAKLATVLLQNRSFTDTYACSLLESKSVLQGELDSIWDGTVIFRDSSYVEDKKRRDAGVNIILQNLHRSQGINEANRKIIASITDNPSAYSSELPAVYVEMTGCPEVERLDKLQQAIGTFLAALIRTLANSDATENLVTAAIKHTPLPQKTVENGGEIGTEAIMRCTATLLSEMGVFDRTHISQLDELFRRGADAVCDQDLAIVNDFRTVLSEMIEKDELRIANQFSSPYYSAPDAMIMLDCDCVNFSAEVLNSIVTRMKSTQRRNVVLLALKGCGKIHANNAYKRLLDVEVEQGRVETLNFYSVPRTMLTPSCQAKLNEIRYKEYLFLQSDYPECFVPIIQGKNGFVAGRVINDETDEAESIYASGKTRSGKTNFEVNHAVTRANCGDLIIIFDQTGAFSQDELRKHLPEEIIDNFFSQWEIGEQGLPVNMLSLENCKSLPDKKQRLANVLSVLARLTGEVQLKVLRSRLAKVVHAVEAGQVRSLAGTLRFFNADEPDQAEILERLEEAVEDLEGLPISQMNWNEFLSSQGKIIIISTASDGIRKSSQYIDALLASLYAWKQHNRTERMTVVLDEIEELSLERDGPVNTILRKGSKHRMSMLLASQEFSAEKDKLGRLIGNCGMQLIFHPKDACIDEIAKRFGIDRQQLAGLEQGECFAVGGFFSKRHGKNKQVTIRGKTYSVAALFAPVEQPIETQDVSDESSELSREPLLEGTADLNDDTISETEVLSFEQLSLPDLDETERVEILSEAQKIACEQSTGTTDDVPETEDVTEEAPHEELAAPTSSDTILPESDNAEPEEAPSETTDSMPVEVTSPDADEADLQHQFKQILHKYNPDAPYYQTDLNDLLTQILEKHHFANQNQREHLQWRFESLIAYCNSENYLAFCEEWKCIFNILWPSINAN
ncbi:MAG: hypothetical protein IKH27_11030 [Oscillospiraceae bacterium]|nr:hypothetical protein [Oscillospiraceae bacterium]MBR3448329.1 hypothetical protein [Oscillospiraceae bacterium]